MNTTTSPEHASVEDLLSHITDEFLQRLDAGEQPDIEAYVQRYPALADVLRQVLPALGVLRQPPSADEASADGLLSGVLGDFRIVREVGRGGMGVVYEAEQISLSRRVALKVLPFAATMDARQLQRFQNEARAAAGLHQEHIVPVHAVGCERGVHFYAMQFIDGRTLAQIIEQQRAPGVGVSEPTTAYAPQAVGGATEATVEVRAEPTPPPGAAATSGPVGDGAYFRRVAEWGVQAAEALEYAHSVGIVHRDIKPANLMVDGHGKLWVTDFGLARTAADSGLTMTGDLLGTLRYMSPEQALAKHGLVDHRTDVYSLGVTLYELLTLRPAVDGKDRQEILQKIAFAEPAPLRRLNRSVPRDLGTVVLKAMAKEVGDRYGMAKELADDLRRVLEDRPIVAKRPTLAQRANKWARRHRAAVWTAMLLLMVVTTGALTGMGLLWQEQDRTRTEAKAKGEALLQKDEALKEKDQALTEKEKALARADANFLKALDGVGQTVQGLGSARPDLPKEAVDLRASVLERARNYFVGFLKQNQQDPALRLETLLAHSYLSETLEQQEDLLGASQSLHEALQLGDRLAADYPGHPRYKQQMDDLRKRIHKLSVALHNQAEAEEKSVHFAAAEQRELAAFRLVDRWGNYDTSADGLLKAIFLTRLSRTLQAKHHLQEAAKLRSQSSDLLNRQAAMNPALAGACLGQRFTNTNHLVTILIGLGEGQRAEGLLREDLQHLASLPETTKKSLLAPAEVHDANLHASLADVLRLLGRIEESNEAARIALKGLPPTSGFRAWLLATVPASDLRDSLKAVELSRSWAYSLERDTTASPLDTATAWTALGIAHLALGESAAAIEALEKAHAILPGGGRGTLFHLALAHARQGNKEKARYWYERAVDHRNTHRPRDLEQHRLNTETATLLGINESPPAKESPALKP